MLAQPDKATPERRCPRAFVAIYFQEQKSATPEETNRIMERLQRYALSQALAVTEIFIEPLNTRPYGVAHKAMVAKLRTRRERHLIVPGVHHFADLGKNPLAVLGDLRALDVDILFAGHVE